MGDPGFRTRDRLSGLDPVATSSEAARIEGKFYKALFTGRLRTTNPIYLSLMLAGGLLFFPASALAIVGVVTSPGLLPLTQMLVILVFLLFFAAIGGALLFNFAASLTRPVKSHPFAAQSAPKSKRKKRGLPKRRKDYR